MIIICLFLKENNEEDKGPFIKDVLKNLEKLTPPLSEKCSNWLNPLTPTCPRGHTKNFEKSEVFCTKKCGRPHL